MLRTLLAWVPSRGILTRLVVTERRQKACQQRTRTHELVMAQVHHVTRQIESTYQRVYGQLHTLKFDDRMPGEKSGLRTRLSGTSPPGFKVTVKS